MKKTDLDPSLITPTSSFSMQVLFESMMSLTAITKVLVAGMPQEYHTNYFVANLIAVN